MADYFFSDVHLRHDRPERGERLARLVSRLDASDTVTVVGDLADFWFASRQRHLDPMSCPGLRSLSEFRSRGGALTILAGNHDALLGDSYTQALGAQWVADAIQVESHGRTLHLAHGHQIGERSDWKALMEGPLFARAFGALPGPAARLLEARLERSNLRHRDHDDHRHLSVFRDEARKLAGTVDVVVFGHVHVRLDDQTNSPRLMIPGSWHDGASYILSDERGLDLWIETDSHASAAVFREASHVRTGSS